MEVLRRKSLLWLLIFPSLLSFVFIAVIKPGRRFSFWNEMALIVSSSFICGFVLALRQFKNFKHRLWGGLFFSGAGVYLIFCVVFLGCLSNPPNPHSGHPLSPAQMQNNLHQQEERKKAWVAKQIVPRDTAANPAMLDLSPFYDEILPGTTVESNPSIRFEKPGIHSWEGIDFDVRGMVGMGTLWDARNIPVGRKCAGIDIVHGAYWGEPARQISRFIVHFTNGHDEIIPIVFGRDVFNSHFSNHQVQTNAVVWAESPGIKAAPQPEFGFFIKKWNNPFPADTIAAIDFIPEQNAFLVAISLKPLSVENQ